MMPSHRKGLKKKSNTAFPPCMTTCVSSSYLVSSCAQLPRTLCVHRARPALRSGSISSITPHACISVYPSIHTDHIHEIQIKSHALSTLIDTWCAAKGTDPCQEETEETKRRKKKMISLQKRYQEMQKN